MLETIQSVPARIADLKRKLAAREGKKEYKENCTAIRAEIARLEQASQSRASLREFIASEGGEPLASSAEGKSA